MATDRSVRIRRSNALLNIERSTTRLEAITGRSFDLPPSERDDGKDNGLRTLERVANILGAAIFELEAHVPYELWHAPPQKEPDMASPAALAKRNNASIARIHEAAVALSDQLGIECPAFPTRHSDPAYLRVLQLEWTSDVLAQLATVAPQVRTPSTKTSDNKEITNV